MDRRTSDTSLTPPPRSAFLWVVIGIIVVVVFAVLFFSPLGSYLGGSLVRALRFPEEVPLR